MRPTKYLGIGILLLVWAGAAMGATLHVPDDYLTIQAAINVAGNGDEIEVTSGTYTENINFNGKAVRLYSSGDPTDTTIHGTGSGSVVTCTSGETSATVLEGFTITGGGAYDGGGMYNSNSSPTVTNCTFSGNSAYHDGGGMFNYYGSPTVTNCTFSGNWATIGSGSGMYNFTSSPTVTDCTFSGNSAPWAGAGMYNWYCSSLTVTNCTFSNNSASWDGGGMFNDRSNALVTNCTFSANSASYDGGGMCNWYVDSTVTNCTFSDNSAYHDGGGMFNYYCSPTVTGCTFSGNWQTIGSGSGMYNFTSSPTVVDCTFSGNFAPYCGAGMYNWRYSGPTVTNCRFSSNAASVDGGGMYNEIGAGATLTNCTFSGNSADYCGGGMCNYSSSPTVTNCTFRNDWAGSGGSMYNYVYSSPTVTNCILWSDSGGEISTPATVAYSDVKGGWPGVGNINLDPLFVGPGDLHISLDSPCVDAGDSEAVPPGVTTDLDGNPRIQGTAVDMGAYECAEQEIVPELYLHGVAPDLTLDSVAPTGTTAKYKDSPGVNRTTFKEIGTWTYVVPPDVHLQLDAARNLYVWLGLKNSDDQGTYFDLRAELLRNDAPIASAETTNIQGITRNANKAKEVVVAFGAIGGAVFSPGDVLSVKILTKVTDVGGHSSAVGLRLYYDSLSRPSRFEPASVP